MTILRIAPARLAACSAAAFVFLVLASSANAAVFCVKDPRLPGRRHPSGYSGRGVQSGPRRCARGHRPARRGDYTTFGFSSSNPVDVVGAGIDKTIVTDTDTGSNLKRGATVFTARARRPHGKDEPAREAAVSG